MSARIVRVADNLPGAFEALRNEAEQEGIRNMTRLQNDWHSGKQRFALPEGLFAAFVENELAGMGGVLGQRNAECPAMRMSRLFVRPMFRRRKIGRALATTMIAHAADHARLLTVNAKASDAAAPFWQSLGFEAVFHDDYTHIFHCREHVR